MCVCVRRDDSEKSPLEVEVTGVFTQIAASHHHALALKGTAACFRRQLTRTEAHPRRGLCDG